jgi:hypothetical protein
VRGIQQKCVSSVYDILAAATAALWMARHDPSAAGNTRTLVAEAVPQQQLLLLLQLCLCLDAADVSAW